MNNMKQYIVKVYDYKTEWLNSDGELDRDDGPALEYDDGSKFWFKNGLNHRNDGPAIEYHDGKEYYFLEGIEYFKMEYYKKINTCSGKIIEVDGKKYTLVPV